MKTTCEICQSNTYETTLAEHLSIHSDIEVQSWLCKLLSPTEKL